MLPEPRLQLCKYLFQLFFSQLVGLLQAVSCPVNRGCLEALWGHNWIIIADKYGIVGPASTIQTDEVFADRDLAMKGKRKKDMEINRLNNLMLLVGEQVKAASPTYRDAANFCWLSGR